MSDQLTEADLVELERLWADSLYHKEVYDALPRLVAEVRRLRELQHAEPWSLRDRLAGAIGDNARLRAAIQWQLDNCRIEGGDKGANHCYNCCKLAAALNPIVPLVGGKKST